MNETLSLIFYYLFFIAPLILYFGARFQDYSVKAYIILGIVAFMVFTSAENSMTIVMIYFAFALLYDFLFSKDLMPIKISEERFRFSITHIFFAIIIAAVLYVAEQQLLQFFFIPEHSGGTEVSNQEILVGIATETDLKKLILYALQIMFVAPIVEEYVFRIALYDFLFVRKLRMNKVFSMLMTSSIFALLHKGLFAVIGTFIMGFTFNIIYERWGLWPAIFAHASANAVVFATVRFLL